MTTQSKIKLTALVGAAAAAIITTVLPQLEGRKYIPYYDSVGVLTVCAGVTNPKPILGKTYTPEECAVLEEYNEVKHAKGFLDCVRVPLTDGQKIAGTLLAYNVGVSATCKSTFVRKLNEGEPQEACNAILMWRYLTINGKKVDCSDPKNRCSGIWKRRLLEKQYCEATL